MVNLLGIVFLSLALNIDAAGVGISYGIRKIKLPVLSIFIICLISMASLSISMLAGNVIENYITKTMSQHIGGFILVLLGAWATYQYFRDEETLSEDKKEYSSETLIIFQIHLLGFLIKILKEPQIADADKSGTISIHESLLLGMALALDSLGAGVAISLMGFNIIITALCVGVCQFLFMYCGAIAGSKWSSTLLGNKISILPGLLLVMIGLSRFFLT